MLKEVSRTRPRPQLVGADAKRQQEDQHAWREAGARHGSWPCVTPWHTRLTELYRGRTYMAPTWLPLSRPSVCSLTRAWHALSPHTCRDVPTTRLRASVGGLPRARVWVRTVCPSVTTNTTTTTTTPPSTTKHHQHHQHHQHQQQHLHQQQQQQQQQQHHHHHHHFYSCCYSYLPA